MANKTKARISPEKRRQNELEKDGERREVQLDDEEDDASNGITVHLGSDLPDILHHAHSSPAPEEQQATMGAQQSALFSPEVRQEVMDAGRRRATTRLSAGQLVQPSKNNPAYKKPTVRPSGTTQRNLGGQSMKRKSQYELDPEPPVKFVPGHSAIHRGIGGFSPTRKQRKAALKDDNSMADASARMRRPRRIQDAEEAHENQNGNDDVYRDHFPDPTAQKHAHHDSNNGPEAEAEVEAEAGEERRMTRSQRRQTTNRTELADSEESITVNLPKRKPGRPRKSADFNTVDEKDAGNEQYGITRRSLRSRKDLLSPDKASQEPAAANKANRTSGSLKPTPKSRSRRSGPRASSLQAGPDEAHASAVHDTNNADENADEDEISDIAMQEAMAEVVGDYDSDNEQEGKTESPKTGTKRKASQSKANTSVKRTKPGASQRRPETQDDSPEGRRWHGAYKTLNTAFNAAHDIGWKTEGRGQTSLKSYRPKFTLEDIQVKSAVSLCKKAVNAFDRLKDGSGNSQADDGQDNDRLEGSLLAVSQRIDILRKGDLDNPFDEQNAVRCCDIYVFLVPNLLKLLRSSLICFETLDEVAGTEGQLTIAHLGVVNRIIRMLLDLIAGSAKYDRPVSDLHIVEPVRNRINPVLRAVHQRYATIIHRHEYVQAQQKEREEQARQNALRLEQEERYSRQQARIAVWQNKWVQLHEERFWAEGGIMNEAKRKHLELPKYDIDQNGMRFERTELFLPRVGPPPGLVDRASKLPWTMVELSALGDGLKQYSGPHVFERIFRKYCRRGAELNKYSVTQIVTMAVMVKEAWIKWAGENGVAMEKWAEDVPVWTKAHEAIGKENEEIEQVEVETQSEGGLFVGASEAVAMEE